MTLLRALGCSGCLAVSAAALVLIAIVYSILFL